jgi:chemotaxis protein methyltransferase CheR
METALRDENMEALEVELLLEGFYRRYGYDFRGYAFASIRRRLLAAMGDEGLASLTALLDRTLRDSECARRILLKLTVHTTALFRDPGFYVAFRQKVAPWLRGLDFLRLWVAGCSTGEEAYSIAILLEEEGLYERCRLYATDLCEDTLALARRGVYPLMHMKDYSENYLAAGGAKSLSDYYSADGENAVLAPALRRNMVFAPHNLVTDASFNEFHLLLCRNVMIYFRKPLQDRVLRLLDASLAAPAVLALGHGESLRFSPIEERYEALDEKERLYRKMRA